MFSGIVEEIGTVSSVDHASNIVMWDGSTSEGYILKVAGKLLTEEAYIGCSIAVNGVCLTAIDIDNDNRIVSFGVSPETCRRSNLGDLKPFDKINVERALKVSHRNSGHFVQGHVDCTGTIIKKWIEQDSLWIQIQVPQEYLKYIVPKGFVAIDGTSLTVCEVNPLSNIFSIMLVSHTQSNVIFPTKVINDKVNIGMVYFPSFIRFKSIWYEWLRVLQ